jgi:hypothetical protein
MAAGLSEGEQGHGGDETLRLQRFDTEARSFKA